MKKILHLASPGPITDESAFLNRRQLMSSLLVASMASGTSRLLAVENIANPSQKTLDFKPAGRDSALKLTDELAATTYNNFYEFGLDKGDPVKNAGNFRVRPWSVVVDGDVAKPQRFDLEQLIPFAALEERVYRMRCVEAWSMVIPWIGVPLASIIKRVEPLAKAKFVAFETLHDPKQMPGQRQGLLNFGSLEWPYREGLRLDEALHPLSFLAVGMYGKSLPPQNGAPLRLVVPWKYGFKGIKSIVRIRLMESMPVTSWNVSAPNEYGFYANVNPDVAHPRWSQAKERRIYSGRLGGVERIETLPFNGYGDQVAKLYSGMDLRRYY